MLSPCTPLVHNPLEPHYDHGWSDITMLRLIDSQDTNKVYIYITFKRKICIVNLQGFMVSRVYFKMGMDSSSIFFLRRIWICQFFKFKQTMNKVMHIQNLTNSVLDKPEPSYQMQNLGNSSCKTSSCPTG